MMINFQISESLPADEIVCYKQRLVSAAQAVLHFTGSSPHSEISLVIVDDETIRGLNKQYLGNDTPTDVLSFPAEEVEPESGNPYLGDILIAFSYAKAQADAAGHAVEDELQLLVVHGVLHLLGYDHAEKADRIRMWQAQAKILNALGCPDDVIPH
ncbi:MAG: rRNA maturation RNase YbeY [Anaerolineales bacterium]|nr:rRNA maturation RNase YbeY [Anaerolineales bacterium]